MFVINFLLGHKVSDSFTIDFSVLQILLFCAIKAKHLYCSRETKLFL